MSLLNFLKAGTVEVPVDAPKVARTSKGQLAPNPTSIAIRVWRDGSVYPSQAAIDKFDLNYRKAVIKIEQIAAREEKKDETGKVIEKAREASERRIYEYPEGQGNAMDVISSLDWKEFNSAVEGKMLFVVVVPRKEPKTDLFSSTVYDQETGNPKSSVAEQGATTYGESTLLPMLKDVYGVELTEEEGKDFVDMVIFETLGSGVNVIDVTNTYSKPIIFVPKKISRGADKGKLDYARRENAKIYGFAPLAMVEEVEREQPVTDYTQDLA